MQQKSEHQAADQSLSPSAALSVDAHFMLPNAGQYPVRIQSCKFERSHMSKTPSYTAKTGMQQKSEHQAADQSLSPSAALSVDAHLMLPNAGQYPVRIQSCKLESSSMSKAPTYTAKTGMQHKSEHQPANQSLSPSAALSVGAHFMLSQQDQLPIWIQSCKLERSPMSKTPSYTAKTGMQQKSEHQAADQSLSPSAALSVDAHFMLPNAGQYPVRIQSCKLGSSSMSKAPSYTDRKSTRQNSRHVSI